jgi:hypothetical protein
LNSISIVVGLGGIILDKCAVFAWVLMDNHAHILFKSGPKGISGFMRKLLTWYAIYYNRRHHRSGHLFENRYKSILCEEENYLLALVRYIHLNPIRARVVKTLHELDCYPWSRHSVIMRNTKCPWMGTDYVLSQFSQTRRAAKMEEECKSRQISLKELNSGSRRRKVSQSRSVVAYRGKEELGLSAAEIARHLGVSTSRITRTIEKMERNK